jgi:hypothetical protein
LVAGAVLLAVVLLTVLIPYTVRFVRAERTLYHADQVAYWSLASGVADSLRSQPWSAATAVSASVATDDVSLLPAAPIAPVMAVLGDSRLAYLLAVLLVYGVAVAIALVGAIAVIDPDSVCAPWWAVATAAAVALILLPGLWRPVFLGYLDLGGVAVCLVILAVYLRGSEPPVRLAELALIGLLVALLALFRRWYTVWSLAFVGVVTIEAAVGCWRRRTLGWRRSLSPLRAPVTVGLVAAGTLAALAWSVMAMRLDSGYADRFASYGRSDSVLSHLESAVDEYGLVTLLLALAGAVWLSLRRPTRGVGVVIGLQLSITWLIMTRVQHHGHQHWYLYGAGIALLLGLPAVRLIAGSRSPGRATVALGSTAALGLLLWLAMYAPWAEPAAAVLEPWVSARRVRPLERSDLSEVTRLLHDLDRRVARDPGYVYVLASSEVVSDQVLAFANRSLGAEFSSLRWILQSAHVDLRDGFPALLLDADWVVTARPVQTHLDPNLQQVIVIPAECFVEHRGIARAFERSPGSFELEGGVVVELFRRVRPIAPEDVADLSDRLRARYPDRPRVYQPGG